MTITTKTRILQSVSAPDIGTYRTECIIPMDEMKQVAYQKAMA